MHLPEERKQMSREELIELAKCNQILEHEIRTLQVLHRAQISEIIDLEKLKNAFFREYKYSYGRKI